MQNHALPLLPIQKGFTGLSWPWLHEDVSFSSTPLLYDDLAAPKPSKPSHTLNVPHVPDTLAPALPLPHLAKAAGPQEDASFIACIPPDAISTILLQQYQGDATDTDDASEDSSVDYTVRMMLMSEEMDAASSDEESDLSLYTSNKKQRYESDDESSYASSMYTPPAPVVKEKVIIKSTPTGVSATTVIPTPTVAPVPKKRGRPRKDSGVVPAATTMTVPTVQQPVKCVGVVTNVGVAKISVRLRGRPRKTL